MRTKSTCSVSGCEGQAQRRGWCFMHYARWQRHGSTDTLTPTRIEGTPEERFWPKVNKNGPVPTYRPDLGSCWIWMGGQGRGDYGAFWDGRHMVPAHRYAYELLVRPIPPGLQIDHLCRVHHCVNPEHLEDVTQQENIHRGMAGWIERERRHCPSGHPYDAENTRWYEGRRYCRACHRERYLRHRKTPTL